jgi:hypothetical protein
MLTSGKGGHVAAAIVLNPQGEEPKLQKQDAYYKEPNRKIILFYNFIIERISRWEDETTSKLNTFNLDTFLIGSRRTGWGADYEKTFTPQTFSYFPHDYTIDEIEIWISK